MFSRLWSCSSRPHLPLLFPLSPPKLPSFVLCLRPPSPSGPNTHSRSLPTKFSLNPTRRSGETTRERAGMRDLLFRCSTPRSMYPSVPVLAMITDTTAVLKLLRQPSLTAIVMKQLTCFSVGRRSRVFDRLTGIMARSLQLVSSVERRRLGSRNDYRHVSIPSNVALYCAAFASCTTFPSTNFLRSIMVALRTHILRRCSRVELLSNFRN